MIMLDNEEKVVGSEEKADQETPKEEENLMEEEKAKKREEAKAAVLEAIKKDVIEKSGMSKEDAEIALEMLDEAQMPISMTDEDFKLGPRELDIRKLSDENYKQVIFRTLLTQGVWLRNVSQLLVDLIRLVYVELDALGVTNILNTTDKVLAKISKEQRDITKNQILKQSRKN